MIKYQIMSRNMAEFIIFCGGCVFMKRVKNFKLPKRKQPFFSFIKRILKLFYKRPEILYCGGEIADGSIIVGNHCSMRGPVVYELYLPAFNAKWGAGEMLGDYKSRFVYLRNVYFMKKKGYNKFFSSIFAAFDACFSKWFYKGMKIIPTWRDMRLSKTISDSVETLKDGTSVLIFPENSDGGYKEVLTGFFSGFVLLAERFFKKTRRDVPVYPVYYSDRENVIVVGNALYVQDYKKRGFTREQIAEELCNKVNELFFRYVNRPSAA